MVPRKQPNLSAYTSDGRDLFVFKFPDQDTLVVYQQVNDAWFYRWYRVKGVFTWSNKVPVRWYHIFHRRRIRTWLDEQDYEHFKELNRSKNNSNLEDEAERKETS